MPSPSHRLQNLPPYVFAVISQQLREMAAAGIDVIRLDIGNPDLPPPTTVMDALSASAHNPHKHGYSGYTGTPSFRQAIARYYEQRFGVSLDPDTEVLPLIGSKEGIVNLSLAFLDTGDVSLIPDIGYPAYSMGARLAGADIHWLPLRAEDNFLPHFDAIPDDIRQRAKILWLNYPNNPTGATADIEFYEQAVAFCAENDILLASDNPYYDITYDGYIAPSALEASEAKAHAVEFMSMSKSFNMAGWRLGAAVGSASALKTLLRVKSNIDSGHFEAVYDAGITALDEISDAWLAERNDVYRLRRDKLMAALPEIGLSADCPQATLYIWATVDDIPADVYVNEARTDAHVSIAPGNAYGPGGDNYVRLSVSIEDERLDEAIERLKLWYTNR